MQQKIKNPRLLHVGKSKQEVAAYYKFLRDEIVLEKTEESKQPTEPTSSSSFEEDDKPIGLQKITPKSWWLQFKDGDWLKSQLLIGIVVFVIGAAVWGYLVLWSDQKSQNTDLGNLKSRVDKLENNDNKISQIDKDLSVFKIEVQKDIDFINYKLSHLKM